MQAHDCCTGIRPKVLCFCADLMLYWLSVVTAGLHMVARPFLWFYVSLAGITEP